MTQRERFLAIGVGGLMLIIGLQWMFTKYRTSLRTRTTQITNLENQKQRLEEELLQGAYADRQMGEYLVRSLPSTNERALGDYSRWLLDLVQANGVTGADVDPTSSQAFGELYQRFSFRVSGKTTLPKVTELLHAFYAKDYLHRIREFNVRPNKVGQASGEMIMELSIDAIALKAAAENVSPPLQPSWKVEPSVAAYRDGILQRNFFSPPNQPPTFAGNKSVDAIVGKETKMELKFEDPEGHSVTYTLVGETPEFIEIDPSSGSLKINPSATGKHDLMVRATDNGFPSRSIEQPLTLSVNDPPPPPEPDKPKPEFDDAKQTVLTGLVQGRDDWTAWMNVRTRGETLKLRVGDSFEIGSLKGTVIEVTQRFALLEIDGRRFTLRPSGNLAEAAKASEDE